MDKKMKTALVGNLVVVLSEVAAIRPLRENRRKYFVEILFKSGHVMAESVKSKDAAFELRDDVEMYLQNVGN